MEWNFFKIYPLIISIVKEIELLIPFLTFKGHNNIISDTVKIWALLISRCFLKGGGKQQPHLPLIFSQAGKEIVNNANPTLMCLLPTGFAFNIHNNVFSSFSTSTTFDINFPTSLNLKKSIVFMGGRKKVIFLVVRPLRKKFRKRVD